MVEVDLTCAEATTQAASCLQESGFCHLTQALPPALLNRFREQFEPRFLELDARMDEIGLDRQQVFKYQAPRPTQRTDTCPEALPALTALIQVQRGMQPQVRQARRAVRD